MGVSLYYSAERDQSLSVEEIQSIEGIIQKFNDNFALKQEAESFALDESDDDTPLEILRGSTKLALHLEQDQLFDSILYWLECLTEIRRVLFDAAWQVNLDDTEIEWRDEQWQLSGM